MQHYTTVIGCDPSLTGTGLCCMTFDDKKITVQTLTTIKTKPVSSPYARIGRYRVIVGEVAAMIQGSPGKPTEKFCTIEAYSFMAMGSAATALPELGALLRNSFQECGMGWVEFAPSSVKKYGSGKGNAKKDMMLLKAQQNFGHMLVGTGLEFEDSNQGDAFIIALMGVDYARWKQFDIKPDKEHSEIFKSMDRERFAQLAFDSLV